MTPAGSAYVADALPRPAPGGAGAGAPPRPAEPAAAGLAGGGTNGAGVTDWPLTQTSPTLRTGPSESVAGASPAAPLNVRVNHTTPSKSGKPRDSQFPGTCMSAHSAASSAAGGVRQSGFTVPMRTVIGRALYGSAERSAW